jgi:hypothetical protein
MISNSIRTGSLCARAYPHVYLKNNVIGKEKCVCQTIYVIHTLKAYRIVSNYVDIIDRFYIHIQRRMMVSHTFFTSTLFIYT